MTTNLDALAINIVLATIIVSPSLWLAGRVVVGKEKAKFTDAILIVVIGVIIGAVFGSLFTGIIAALIQFIVWLALVRHFFDCGWGAAFGITLLMIVIFVVIAAVLGLAGFALFTGLL
jgi:hypothetical protein